MTFIQTCDICGAKIEIEDTDDLEPNPEPLISGEEESMPELNLCLNCSNNINVTSLKHS